MFENSTVCHLVDELILCALSMAAIGLVVVGLGF
jgi:hypothetical protein